MTTKVSSAMQDLTDDYAFSGTYTEGSTRSTPTHIVFHVVAGGVSSQTWKVRGGGHVASTVTINGDGGARKFGGVGHSFMQIEEIAV
jgi:hypothetical protein